MRHQWQYRSIKIWYRWIYLNRDHHRRTHSRTLSKRRNFCETRYQFHFKWIWYDKFLFGCCCFCCAFVSPLMPPFFIFHALPTCKSLTFQTYFFCGFSFKWYILHTFVQAHSSTQSHATNTIIFLIISYAIPIYSRMHNCPKIYGRQYRDGGEKNSERMDDQ